MNRLRFLSLCSVVVFFVAAPLAISAQEQASAESAIDVTGEWLVTMEMMDANLTLTQEGATLTGMLESDQGALEVEGEVEGNEVVFWGYFDAYTLGFYAVLEDSKSMSGTLEAGDGEFVVEFTAVRVEQQ